MIYDMMKLIVRDLIAILMPVGFSIYETPHSIISRKTPTTHVFTDNFL